MRFTPSKSALVLACLVTLSLSNAASAAVVDKFMIGFNVKSKNGATQGEHYLFWRGDAGNTKNGEFRKGAKGDKFFIEKVGANAYKIGFNVKQKSGATLGKHFLYWRGDAGNTKNAEFRKGGKGDTFFIEYLNNRGTCKIGFIAGADKYYLFWRGDRGNTKNAEFRKGNKGDIFEIHDLSLRN